MGADPNQAKSIFLSAIEGRTPEEWGVYLDEVCRGDVELRQRVEALLAAHQGTDRLLDEAGAALIGSADVAEPMEAPGTVIGRYKLLERIGEGGMAVVYMAEQEQPIRRKVALKIIKLGMDTRQVIARFEAERQALALMDHPCIAKVLDAGSTETGRPYFVMELVTGVSITEYCDKNRLNTKDRLALFLQVCQAVQHAHTKGIIHRDIKPSNVMVTHHDGIPIPKVIDFGIAKATNQKLTEKTLFTRYAHIIGTPAYMSPEQAELSDLDIDTRSDIYSLGVLLYELLTGATPFSEEELRQAGYAEMQRVIREQEPVKPSTKLSTLGETLTDIAKRRDSTPDLLRKAIRGDLDWIAMRSLEKDRVRRYETASGLAEDIRRHLEHEPILARGPGAAYRLRKFLRRHRMQAVVALTLGTLTVAVGVVLSMWNQDRRQLAEAEGFRQRGILSQAQGQYASGDHDAALETLSAILDSKHVGPAAQLLQAGILADNRRFDEATAILRTLLAGRREIAGAAHALLARILWESGELDAEKLKQIEEHHQKAETLLPETAEAYFSRAMTALTVKEQLGALNKALQLKPDHYESLRLRAFTYYASRKYQYLKDDAVLMAYLRPRDPSGYSLRAVAWRELGRYRDAIADYNDAISLTPAGSPQCLDLTTQRSETLLRMGRYEDVITGAQEALRQWPDQAVFQYHLFCARMALGEYDKADAVFRAIVQRTPTARDEFRLWATKYVFDTLEAGRSWHPAGPAPTGPAFLPLVEAEEMYRDLSAKAHRVVTNGFSAQWSPNGKKLAFSVGVRGYSGVALYDPATKETDLLIVPGKDPRWSPDGKYIAFVRDCQALRLEELTASERKKQTRRLEDEEVWVMNADGTDPRRLARGGWPSWSTNATDVYYHSRVDKMVYSISLAGPQAQPKPIRACSDICPSVSPDGQRVTDVEGLTLTVRDLDSQAVVAQWNMPFDAWEGPAWSPTGRELCLGASGSVGDRTGLWIYRLDSNEPVKVLSSQVMAASWAPDGTKLVFGLRPPYFELWVADLDPAAPTAEALGPGQTLAEHWQDMLRLYTRRIEADPQDASAYADRARYYGYLHDRAKANADMRRAAAAMSGRWPLNVRSDLRWVINLPFDCELVFSAERPVNETSVLSIAFGQKGRCEMKLCEIPMAVMSLVSLYFLSGPGVPSARADFVFGEPVETVISTLDPSTDYVECCSSDGLEMYVQSNRPGGHGNYDVWVCRRNSTDAAWGPLENLGPAVNTPGLDFAASISADGLTLHFACNPAGYGDCDIYMTTRANRSAPWGQAVNLGATMPSLRRAVCPHMSSDGLELYFMSDRPGGLGGTDIYVSRRATVSDPWGDAVNLGALVNDAYWVFTGLCLSPDGLLLFYAEENRYRPDGYGGGDLWMTRRASLSSPWQESVNLGPMINGPGHEGQPGISRDGSILYFIRRGGSRWQAPILPIVDFNGDGNVDAKDADLLMADWGTSNSVCDIGPFPWGDGVVDGKDLAALMKSLVTPSPRATLVPCDAALSWILPSLTPACDLYFGTSFADVNNASRTDPCGVLVSLGQTATTYDPEGFLELQKTYYWRLDLVSADANPTIYRGDVWQFTTEPAIYPVQSLQATASSYQPGMGPEKTIDCSGLDANDLHSDNQTDMWWSRAEALPWIQYEFDRVYRLHEMSVWNHNMAIEPSVGFGARTVQIEYSTDGTTWTALEGVPEFARAPGLAGYAANTTVNFGGISTRYVKLTILKNWGTTQQTGLSEVRFYAMSAAAVIEP